MLSKKIMKRTTSFFQLQFPAILQIQKRKKNKKITDNEELKTLYEKDQSERTAANIDWKIVNKNDSLQQARVIELLDSGRVITGNDYYHTAMIFQHGLDTFASGMAVKMMTKALELDTTVNKWLLAAAIDRDLI